MFADTDAIRGLGSANAACAADLTEVAATLSSLSASSLGSMFGPVAARFVAALVDAAAEGSRALNGLGERLAASQAAAYAAASAYEAADHRAGVRVAGR